MATPTVLVVDNYDSFAYNLVQYVGAHADVVVRRNDAIDVAGIRELDPDGVVVSPGPGTPSEAGVSVDVFSELDYPALGVCLGHQALCRANGADVTHAPSVVHGKPSTVAHDGRGLFEGLPDRFEVGRYHSLTVERDALPDVLEETAWTVRAGDDAGGPVDVDAAADAFGDVDGDTADGDDDGDDIDDGDEGVLMGVRHRERPHVGVQFHPESILTDAGERMIETFCQRCTTT